MIDPTDEVRSAEGDAVKSRENQINPSQTSSVIVIDESGPSQGSLPCINGKPRPRPIREQLSKGNEGYAKN